MTKDELTQSLPERLRGFRIIGPYENLYDANLQAAYYAAAYQEAVAVAEKAAEAKRQFLTEKEVTLALTRLFRKEFGDRRFQFVSNNCDGLRMVSEPFDFDAASLTAPLIEFSEQHLLGPVKNLVAKIGEATQFSRLREVGSVDMKGFAEDWVSCFSVRMIRAYDIRENLMITQLDALVK